ncbi:MAG TPA: dihydroorotase [Gammaproteobacteria bacterium]|nr:dihydroorotase [Gammaproteobacteria bacterium]
MHIRIRNGRVIDPANAVDAQLDVFVADGKIVAVGKEMNGFQADEEINADGHWVIPGLVDLAARMREPGLEHKATIASETRAAAASGITTLCCPPDTLPIIDTPAVAELIQKRAEQAGFANLHPIAALTKGLQGENLSEMASLKNAGCVAVYNTIPLANTQIQRLAMEYAATHNLIVFISPVDPWLSNNGCVHEGRVSTRLGLPGIPTAAETAAVARDLALVEQVGVHTHFTRISTARAARMIARAQYDGLPVTADVCAHQFHLTEMDICEYDSNCHVIPPFRTQRDLEGLREAISQNVIQAICSDHQPHEPDAKLAPFGSTLPGISALETLLPLSLRLIDEENLPVSETIRRITSGPANILNTGAGTLGTGRQADICIMDPEKIWQLSSADMVSHGHNTPFANWEFKGKAVVTLFKGRVVYRHNQNTLNG